METREQWRIFDTSTRWNIVDWLFGEYRSDCDGTVLLKGRGFHASRSSESVHSLERKNKRKAIRSRRRRHWLLSSLIFSRNPRISNALFGQKFKISFRFEQSPIDECFWLLCASHALLWEMLSTTLLQLRLGTLESDRSSRRPGCLLHPSNIQHMWQSPSRSSKFKNKTSRVQYFLEQLLPFGSWN